MKKEALKFSERVAKSQEDKDQQDIQYKLEDQQEQLKADIKETSRTCKRVDREAEEMKDDINVSWTTLAEKVDESRRYKQGLEDLKELQKELF